MDMVNHLLLYLNKVLSWELNMSSALKKLYLFPSNDKSAEAQKMNNLLKAQANGILTQ